jgi:hypothetical protein
MKWVEHECQRKWYLVEETIGKGDPLAFVSCRRTYVHGGYTDDISAGILTGGYVRAMGVRYWLQLTAKDFLRHMDQKFNTVQEAQDWVVSSMVALRMEAGNGEQIT